MDMIEIEIDEEGRIVRPRGVRLRIPAQRVVPEREEPDEERRARIERFFKETDEALKDVPLRPMCPFDRCATAAVIRSSRSTDGWASSRMSRDINVAPASEGSRVRVATFDSGFLAYRRDDGTPIPLVEDRLLGWE